MAKISVLTFAPRKDDLPFSPYVCIYLSQHSKDDSGRSLMSPKLTTDNEIDTTVNQLIQQLKKAGKEAKQELKKEKKQLHDSLQE